MTQLRRPDNLRAFPVGRGVPRVNTKHPLAAGLVGCFVPGLTGGIWLDLSSTQSHMNAAASPAYPPIVIAGRGPSSQFGAAYFQKVYSTSPYLITQAITHILWATPGISQGSAIGQYPDSFQRGPNSIFYTSGGLGYVILNITAQLELVNNANGIIPPVLPGTFHQAAVTYQGAGGLATAHIDGVLLTSNTPGGSGFHNYNTMGIGLGDSGNYYDGVIDHVKFYNRALSPQEIAAEFSDPFGMLTFPPLLRRTFIAGSPSVAAPAVKRPRITMIA